jgi:hypothetical protein
MGTQEFTKFKVPSSKILIFKWPVEHSKRKQGFVTARHGGVTPNLAYWQRPLSGLEFLISPSSLKDNKKEPFYVYNSLHFSLEF